MKLKNNIYSLMIHFLINNNIINYIFTYVYKKKKKLKMNLKNYIYNLNLLK